MTCCVITKNKEAVIVQRRKNKTSTYDTLNANSDGK